MLDEVADVVSDLIILVVNWKSAQYPMKIGFPVSLVAADRSAKRDDCLRTSRALPRPDLNAEAANGFALTRRPHFARVRPVATPDVAPLIEPGGRALRILERVAVVGVVGNAAGRARRHSMLGVDARVVSLLREQGIGQYSRRSWAGNLLRIIVVLPLGSLDNLIRVLSQMQLRAASEKRNGDRNCGQICRVPKAYHPPHRHPARAVQRSLLKVISNMASRPPSAAAKRSWGVVSDLLQRRTL